MSLYEVCVIGAGAVGCAIARELSKYNLKVCVIEKNEDVGGDASKSNSAIIHTGFDASPGTLESEMVVSANPMYDKLCKDLDIPFKRIGAIMPAITDEQFEKLPEIMNKAYKNKVYDIEYLSRKEVLNLEPNINPDVKAGLYIPRESIIDPFLLVVALAENAADNGVEFKLSCEVKDIVKESEDIIVVKTPDGDIKTKYVINAAGLHSDDVATMIDECDFKVNPRKGQFYILDKNTECKVNQIVLPIPTKLTKGKLMCPTIHGNMLVGPTAEDSDDKENRKVTSQGLEEVSEGVSKLVPGVKVRDSITQYAGLRPNRTPEGYNIYLSDKFKGYLGISGIRSTGLTSSVSVGKYVVKMLKETDLVFEYKKDFISKRKGVVKLSELTLEEQDRLVKENPLYGNIICRCEKVSEGEILDAINRTLGARSLDGIKRRVRAGMGRCQGGFCAPRVLEILSRELEANINTITKSGKGSEVVFNDLR
ncbi:Anaerobic glycerol-3-phosphate dehydrogenase subunit A [uncultured Clostridium sp.]|uniref:NAD(P)/FAD-dependent oxidoreductase n=1 Tax=uncultured Clostridium sp. TaxID=59620 RepID=UPI0008220E8F|nr:NAD(P)/FAD-dependent oxidoreductase [uncultured Clostridium sp.]SCK04213.1 Anaerobic glycerol-3-phosphate dehydrogenase subunit A [uncultured Clostridium sp.]